ncbi:hypothetical protein C8R43DRAFT_1134393 [Mycena crocata]|nr:hypothetical protein C8R43DRAFT_1134393 [Mycena crocata]
MGGAAATDTTSGTILSPNGNSLQDFLKRLREALKVSSGVGAGGVQADAGQGSSTYAQLQEFLVKDEAHFVHHVAEILANPTPVGPRLAGTSFRSANNVSTRTLAPLLASIATNSELSVSRPKDVSPTHLLKIRVRFLLNSALRDVVRSGPTDIVPASIERYRARHSNYQVSRSRTRGYAVLQPNKHIGTPFTLHVPCPNDSLLLTKLAFCVIVRSVRNVPEPNTHLRVDADLETREAWYQCKNIPVCSCIILKRVIPTYLPQERVDSLETASHNLVQACHIVLLMCFEIQDAA